MTWYPQKNKSLSKVFPTGKSHPLHQREETLVAEKNGRQLFKVSMQEKHPQANDWRNFPALTPTTTAVLHTQDLHTR